MDPTMTAASAVLARLNIVAELLELEIAELYALSALLAAGMARYSHISINGTFDQLAIRTAFPDPLHTGELVGELRRRDQLFGETILPWLDPSSSRRNFVTVRSDSSRDAGLTLEFRSEQKEALAAALATHQNESDLQQSDTRLNEMLSEYLGAGGKAIAMTESWRAPAYHSRLVHGVIPPTMNAEQVLSPVAAALDIPASQRGLLEDMHPILARRHGARFALRFGAGVIFPELHLSYRNLPIERVLQLLVGLQVNREPGPKLGAFIGAIGAEDPSIVTVVLGPQPPTVELAIDVTPE